MTRPAVKSLIRSKIDSKNDDLKHNIHYRIFDNALSWLLYLLWPTTFNCYLLLDVIKGDLLSAEAQNWFSIGRVKLNQLMAIL